MKNRIGLLLATVLASFVVLAALAEAGSAQPTPVNRGNVRFCPSWGGALTLRSGQMCVGPSRHSIYFVDTRVLNAYAVGGYGICVGVVNPFSKKFVAAPVGRNPRCGHTNYVSNYLGDLFGGLTGSPAVLNASPVPLQVQSSFSSRLPG